MRFSTTFSIGFINIVREELQQDFNGTLSKLSAMGYQGVEFGVDVLKQYQLSADQFVDCLQRNNLKLVTLHTTKYPFLENKTEEILQIASQIGTQYLTIAWGPVESCEQLAKDAQFYNQLGKRCREYGITLTYHNHDHEFTRLDGQYAWDILCAELDPEWVLLHLDIAWITFAGLSPVSVLQKYGERCVVIHAKDLRRLEEGCLEAKGDRKLAQFIEVGDGIVEVQSVLRILPQTKVKWVIVEQDRPYQLAPMESLKRSIQNLHGLIQGLQQKEASKLEKK